MLLAMPIASKTKNVAVYKKLRQAIIKGKLKPGQKLIMAELAKSFGLSETPVREAIRRLESDGHVHFTPHLIAIVTNLDERELKGLIHVNK
jgi:DNA-binding GntR family transcriptional regulator